MNRRSNKYGLLLCVGVVFSAMFSGCAQLRVPRIDPLGRRIFLPHGSTTILTPRSSATQQAVVSGPIGSQPAFQAPTPPPPCDTCGTRLGTPSIQPSGPLISHHRSKGHFDRKRQGQLVMTPSRIVAPVGSEVVVMSGICNGDGYFVINQPIEWMLSGDSVGQIVEVGGMEHELFNRLIKPSSTKFAGDYAWGRTALKPKLITRGTDTPVDDLQVRKGQAWLTVSSASEGTSYLTCVAPKTESWPERKSTTRIHWVDAIWSIPVPSASTAGTIHPMTVSVQRTSDGQGVPGWKVRYQIVGGVPAEFHPQGTQAAEVVTDSSGQAPIQIRQPAGQASAGATQVKVDIVRPAIFGQREMVLESGITTVTWSSPALTIRTIGPRVGGINEPINYQIQVSNPGDQVARGVIVSTDDISGDVKFISSTPSPSSFGDRLEWALGDVQPGAQPQTIQIQLSTERRGPLQLCFDVASQSDQLRTQACGETQIQAPCIALVVNGPDRANVGDNIRFDLDLTNDCDETLENVLVRVQYDPGLQITGMPNPLEWGPIPTLMPDQTENIPTLELKAIQPGTHGFLIEITANGGHIARSQQYVQVENVVDPKVRIEMQSQQAVQLGQQVLVRMRVTNVGNVPLEQVTVLNKFSSSLTPMQRSPVPQRWIGDDLAFDLGRLTPGQQSTVEILFDTTESGAAVSQATVSTALGASDTAGVNIRIDPRGGAPAGGGPVRIPPDQAATEGLRVSVAALQRSVRVNSNAVFRVTIINDRRSSDQQVAINLLIPLGTRLVTPDPNQIGLRGSFVTADNTRFQFEPRREMLPGETMSFDITLVPQQTGQPTFAVQVTSANTTTAISGQDSITIVE